MQYKYFRFERSSKLDDDFHASEKTGHFDRLENLRRSFVFFFVILGYFYCLSRVRVDWFGMSTPFGVKVFQEMSTFRVLNGFNRRILLFSENRYLTLNLAQATNIFGTYIKLQGFVKQLSGIIVPNFCVDLGQTAVGIQVLVV